MMRRRFLYFIPGVPGVNPQMLSARGLTTRFAMPGGELQEHGVTGGAGPGGSGCIVALGMRPAEYVPDRQTWLQGEKFWVGIEDNALRPTPNDLVRELGFAGHEIVLGDANAWRIPLLRRWNTDRCEHVSALPKMMRPIVENGATRLACVVSPEFEFHDSIAERIWQAFLKQETLSQEALFSDCVSLLSINYRIGIEEAGLLGLLDQEIALKLLGLSIDLPALQAQANGMALDGIEAAIPTIDDEVTING